MNTDGPMSTAEPMSRVDRWIDALIARHTAALSRPEFLKAVRAVSARYTERRAQLGSRSPIDSAGKKAAFAAFFAPLHFVTAQAAAAATGADREPLDAIVDLGCGTGVASAAWASAFPGRMSLHGVDLMPWSLQEAAWNWRMLQLDGRTERRDLVAAASQYADRSTRLPRGRIGFVLGWSINELAMADRDRLLPHLVTLAHAGHAVLVLEPLANAATPWWGEWERALGADGGMSATWKFDVRLPRALAELDEAAGFRREHLGVKTLFVPGRGGRDTVGT